MKNQLFITLFCTAIISSSTYAGGLFGDGGFIRGDVGNFFDNHIDKNVTPIVKPLAKGTAALICGGIAYKSTASAVAAGYAAHECHEAVK